MTAESPGNWGKSIMPVAWTKSYDIGKKGKVFTTTMGSAIDFLSEDLRRMVVNACYWALDMQDDLPEKAHVNIVGNYQPTMFGFGSFQKGKLPRDFAN
jgi:type 1 glutamine amidotransferase